MSTNPEITIFPQFTATEQANLDKLQSYANEVRGKIDSDNLSESVTAEALLPVIAGRLAEYAEYTVADRTRRLCDEHCASQVQSLRAYLESQLAERMTNKSSFMASAGKSIAKITAAIFAAPANDRSTKYAERDRAENELEQVEQLETAARHKITFFQNEPSLVSVREAAAAVACINLSCESKGV
jgi:hypothetical protein